MASTCWAGNIHMVFINVDALSCELAFPHRLSTTGRSEPNSWCYCWLKDSRKQTGQVVQGPMPGSDAPHHEPVSQLQSSWAPHSSMCPPATTGNHNVVFLVPPSQCDPCFWGARDVTLWVDEHSGDHSGLGGLAKGFAKSVLCKTVWHLL